MASPDCKDGWMKYAHELDAALSVGDFSKKARIVLRAVFEQIFGPAKLKLASLSPTAISKAIGRPRQYAEKGIGELVASKVLERVGLKEFKFLKNYETWKTSDGERSRFTPEEINWIRDAVPRSLTYLLTSNGIAAEKPSTESVTHQQEPVTISGDKQVPASTESVTYQTSCVTNNGDCQLDRLQTSPIQLTSHIERACGIQDRRKEKGGESPLPPSQVAPLPQGPNSSPPLSSPAAAPPPDETTALSCPAVPTVNGLWTLQPGKYRPGPEIVAELFALAWTLFPGRNIAYEVWERQRWYEPPVWAAALREAKRTKPNLDRVNYIEKIAAKYAEQGLPKSSEGPSAGSGLLAPPKIINRTPDDEFVVFPKDDRPRRYVPPGSRKPRTEAEIREYFRKRAQQKDCESTQTQNLGRAGA